MRISKGVHEPAASDPIYKCVSKHQTVQVELADVRLMTK